MPKAAKKSDAAEEAAEAPMERRLTALGKATLARMKKQFGEEAGETRFNSAIRSGQLARARMYKS